MRWACFRQKKIEGPFVYPPVAADLEAGKNAALDQAINRRGVHAQYFGNFADSKESRELFHLLPPDPFNSCATSDEMIRIHPNGSKRHLDVNALSQIFQRFGRAAAPPMRKLP